MTQLSTLICTASFLSSGSAKFWLVSTKETVALLYKVACLNTNLVFMGRSFVPVSVGLSTLYAYIKAKRRQNSASSING